VLPSTVTFVKLRHAARRRSTRRPIRWTCQDASDDEAPGAALPTALGRGDAHRGRLRRRWPSQDARRANAPADELPLMEIGQHRAETDREPKEEVEVAPAGHPGRPAAHRRDPRAPECRARRRGGARTAVCDLSSPKRGRYPAARRDAITRPKTRLPAPASAWNVMCACGKRLAVTANGMPMSPLSRSIPAVEPKPKTRM